MGFEGEIATWCPNRDYDFKHVWAVTVSGESPNVCGHMLLNLGGCGPSAMYFHVVGRPAAPGQRAGLRWYPLQMSQAQYSRYRLECKKIEWRRMPLELPNPAGARAKLEELLTKKWLWLVLPHNCVAFVEEVIRAGGSGEWWMRCPALDGRDPWVVAR